MKAPLSNYNTGWGMLACRTCIPHLSTAGRGRGMAEIWREAPAGRDEAKPEMNNQ